METIFLQVLLMAMFANTALAVGLSMKHKVLCDWDLINEVVNYSNCKPYAAHSPDKPQQSPDKPQQSPDKPQQSPDKTEQTLQAIMVVPSKPSEGTEQCACFFQCSMIIVGILTFFALLALLIATYVAGCQMMMAVK